MSKISFEDIGAVVATFETEEGVKGGQTVKMTENGTAGPCAAGDRFCGVALEPRNGCGAVQVKGFVTVAASGELTVGWADLEADGKGGVREAESGGVTALVVSVGGDGTAVLCL